MEVAKKATEPKPDADADGTGPWPDTVLPVAAKFADELYRADTLIGVGISNVEIG